MLGGIPVSRGRGGCCLAFGYTLVLVMVSLAPIPYLVHAWIPSDNPSSVFGVGVFLIILYFGVRKS